MRSLKLLLPLLASTLCFAGQADRITGPIDSSQMVALPGHLNRRAQPQYDQGPVEPSHLFGHVTLVMAPSPSQQVALNLLLAQQQDRSSPNYHKWLTPEQFAGRFGVSQGDIDKITAWLGSQGFQAVSAARGRTSVSFSGTAAQLQSAFKMEMHTYNVNGETHIANSAPVEVPAALSGVVTAVRGLTDFHPKPMYVRPVHGGKSGPHPSYTTTIQGNTDYVLAPGDIATIYDINPFYNASTPIDGTGQKLAIIGETDIYLADITDFRSGFGLNPITGCSTDANGIVTATSCNTTNFQYLLVPGVADLGAPSTCGDLPEADLDIEWSGATARNAQIIFVNAPATFNSQCTEITNNGGTNVALAYAIDHAIAPVISMSYGLCEAEAESFETELQQGTSQGITIMNSSGDSGSAACDDGPPNSTLPHEGANGGLTVNYPASSQYVTGVGGTSIPVADFTSTYWNANGVGTVNNGASALAALEGQETSWNDDAAFAQLCQEDPSNLFCTQGGSPAVTHWVDITSAQTAQEDLWVSAGGGGVSNCINETGEGICTSGFARPSWQTVTIPSQASPQSTYRLVPDVSLLASPNYPGYIFCTPLDQWTSSSSTASTCAGGIPTAVDTYESLVGGTSASSPIFAGIVALLNQYLGTGSAGLGNINPTLYSLAATPANGAFHHITSGDNDVYCQAGTPAGQPGDVICPSAAVFGFESSNADSTTGYNLVAGLGSVDANSLGIAWKATLAPDFGLTASALTPTSVSAGQSASSTLTISPVTGSTGMVVNFSPSSCAGLPTGATCSFNPASVTFTGSNSPTTTVTISTLPNMAPSGPTTITITPTNSSSTTTTVSLTVTATTESFSLAATNGVTFPVTVGGAASVTVAVSGTNGFIVGSGVGATTALPLTYSCTGSPPLATAEISCQISPGNGQPTNATSVSISLVTTPPTTGQLRPPLDRGGRIFYAMLLPGLFGIVFAAGSRARGLRLLSLIAVLGFSTLWLGSCGGSGGGGSKTPTNPGTPAGTYVVTIGATTTGGASNFSNSNAPYTITLNVSQ
jgi:subtilase family serine protease